MVFGWRASKVAATQRPKAPGVEEILADLESTDSRDPVFALSSDLLKGWLETENTGSEDISDPNVLYDKVTNYVNSKQKLQELESKILLGTESLEHSLVDLKQLAKQVQHNLEAVKNNQAIETSKQNIVSHHKEPRISSDQESLESSPPQENLGTSPIQEILENLDTESEKKDDTDKDFESVENKEKEVKSEIDNISDSDEVNLC